MKTRSTFLERFTKTLINARERAVRRRVRQYLRSLSDRQLEDMGFSRALLEDGPKAWPWRVPAELDGGASLAAALRARETAGPKQPVDYVRHNAEQTGYPLGTDDKLAA